MGVEISTLVEHRCSVRHAVDLPVELRTPRSGGIVLRARVVNICSGGACIELPADSNCGRLVEVVGPGTGPWPALVVHREGATVGIMFDRSRQQEVEELLHRATAYATSVPGSPGFGKLRAATG